MDDYLKAAKIDSNINKEYFLKSLVKTEQQKFLEKLLQDREKKELLNIADLACGAGTLSYHLRNIYKNAKFTLLDYNDDAINLAKSTLTTISNSGGVEYSVGNLTDLPYRDNEFDAVFMWMTLGWVDKEFIEKILYETIRVLKPGCRAYISSLFNLDSDVDVLSKVYDYTRKSASEDIYLNYNTYSKLTISNMLKNKVNNFEIIKFSPEIDINHDGRGIGTYTKQLVNGDRLQISGGMLMNWGILIIEK